MGNSRKYRESFFSRHVNCCFCGGATLATQIEHMPSRAIFINKQRPKGFEFPTCDFCNGVSRKSEAVVAFLVKTKFDLPYPSDRDRDLTKLINFLLSQCPGTVEELLRGRDGNLLREKELRRQTGTNFKLVELGPLSKRHLALFNAKMGIAAYYEHSKKALPLTGGVLSDVHTKIDQLDGNIPNFPGFLGQFQSLKQGAFTAADQFSYRYAQTPEGEAAIFQFTFHDNFLVTSFVFSDLTKLDEQQDQWISPGKLMPIVDESTNPLAKYRYAYRVK
jgi:hypothetical protein